MALFSLTRIWGPPNIQLVSIDYESADDAMEAALANLCAQANGLGGRLVSVVPIIRTVTANFPSTVGVIAFFEDGKPPAIG